MYKNRVTTLILALSMFMSATISASAEDFATIISAIIPMTAEEIFPEILDDKPIEFWSDINNRVTTVVGATDYDSKSGDWSLCAVFKNSKTGQNEYIENTYIPVTLKSGVTYSFGVWCKGSDIAKTKVFISVDGTNNIRRLQAAETEDGWTKYYNTITPSSDITGNICFGFDADFSSITDKEEIKILFDDVYIYKDGSHSNLVYNSSFEERLKETDLDEEIVDDLPQILTGKTIEGWSDLNYGGSSRYLRVGPTDFDAKTGEYSLCTVFENKRMGQKDYITNTLQQVTIQAGTTYNYGVWLRGKSISSNCSIFIAVGDVNKKWDIDRKSKTVDGWTLYTGSCTSSENITGYLSFGFDADFSSATGSVTVLFDDAYMYASNSDVNLVDNPSFEVYNPITPKGTIYATQVKVGGFQAPTDASTNLQDINGEFYATPATAASCVYRGSKSLYVYRKANNGFNNAAYIRGNSNEVIPPGTYKITFYTKGSVTTKRNIIGIRQEGIKIDIDASAANAADSGRFNTYTQSYAGNGWTKYEKTFTTIKESNLIEYYINAWGNNESYYIDEISVVDIETGKNYFTNGNFEECYVYGEGDPIRFVAYSASNYNSGKAVISWKNPKRSDITHITLKVDGEINDFTPNTESLGFNEVILTGLKRYSEHICELTITAGGEDYTSTKRFTHYSTNQYYDAAGNIPLQSWRLLRVESAGNYDRVNLSIDTEYKYSGNSSLRITCGTVNTVNDVYARLLQNVTLKKNKAYRFTAKVKGIGLDNAIEVVVGNWTQICAISDRSSWTTISGIIDANDSSAPEGETYNTKIAFHIAEGADAAWIDDVTLREWDGSAEAGENIIKNGDFEYPQWQVNGYSFSRVSDGNAVSSIEEGAICGTVDFFNFSKENFNLVAVSALYEDGELIDISCTEQEDVPINTNPFSPNQISSSVTVPSMDPEKTYEVKVFFWDSIKSMNPLSKDTGLLTK